MLTFILDLDVMSWFSWVLADSPTYCKTEGDTDVDFEEKTWLGRLPVSGNLHCLPALSPDLSYLL